ncbi:hypothetical protein KKF61_06245 [Patescibacteria group bacterium]|nr:hypothetical protein [Patescibacteria group bacterium]
MEKNFSYVTLFLGCILGLFHAAMQLTRFLSSTLIPGVSLEVDMSLASLAIMSFPVVSLIVVLNLALAKKDEDNAHRIEMSIVAAWYLAGSITIIYNLTHWAMWSHNPVNLVGLVVGISQIALSFHIQSYYQKVHRIIFAS